MIDAAAKPDSVRGHSSNPQKCPKCTGGKLRPSRKRHSDWLRALFGWKPYRCDRCRERMYRR